MRLLALPLAALALCLAPLPAGAHGNHTTTTSVTCSPATINQGASTTCTASVQDQAGGAQRTAPEGPVNFSSNQAGITNPFASCNLNPGANFTSTCSVTHTPTASGTFTITAAFQTHSASGHTWNTSSNTTSITVNPPAPTHLTVENQPTNTVAGESISDPTGVQVAIRNSLGNIATTSSAAVTIAIQTNAGGGVLSGTLTVNAVNGIATFSNLSIDKVGTGYRLRATASGLTGVNTNTFNITPGAPAQLSFAQQPPDTTAGDTIGGGIGVTARIEDQFGNVAHSANADITVAIANNPGGGTLDGTVTRATVNGVATFDDLSIDAAGVAYTLGATSNPSYTAATSADFDIVAGAANRLAFGVPPPDTTAGEDIGGMGGITVRIEDAAGNLVDSSEQITLALGTHAGTATLLGTKQVSAVNGVATFTGLTIERANTGYTLTASATGLSGTTSPAFDITPAAPSVLAFGQPPTNNEADETISPDVTVRVEDAFGNLIPGDTRQVTVSLAQNPGSATLGGTLQVNAVNGIATFGDLEIDVAASGYTLLAEAGGVAGVESDPFEIAPGVPVRLEFDQQPTDSLAGDLISPAVTVRILDDPGNVVTTATNAVTLAIQANPGGGTLSGTTTVNAVNGVATFDSLSINNTGDGYTLAASATSLGTDVSDSFDVDVNTAARVRFAQQPANTVAGQVISGGVGGITARVEDASGNLVPSSAPITVAIEFDAGLGNLGGTTTVNAVNGIATFDDLWIDKAGTGYTLNATSGSLDGDISADFNITHASADNLAFQVHPSNTTAGNDITPAVTVRVRDEFDNLVTSGPGSTSSVSLSIANNPPGTGVLSGTKTRNAVNGVASFSGLSINRDGDGYTLAAASAGLAGATSNAFNINTASASRLTFTVQPTDTVLNGTITPALQVAVQDALGNTITTDSSTVISLALDSNPGGADLGGTIQRTVNNGVAVFDDLFIDRTGNGYTIEAISSGLDSAFSSPFNITEGPPAQLAFSQQVYNTPPNTNMTPWPVVQVQDVEGNPVDYSGQITITLGNPRGATLSGTTTVSATNGVAVFSDLQIDLEADDYHLIASSPGLASGNSNDFNVLDPGFTLTGITPGNGPSIGGTTVTLNGSGFSGNPQDRWRVIFGTENPAPPVVAVIDSNNAIETQTPAHPPGLVNVIVYDNQTGGTRALQDVFEYVASAPVKLRFGQQPSDITAGDPFSPVVTVEIQDANNNLVNNTTNTVTIEFYENLPGGALLGTQSVSAVGGVASFADLSVDKAGSGYRLVAHADGLESTLPSDPFAVTAGAASQLAFGVQPTNNDPGIPIEPAIEVRTEDAFGNLVTSGNPTINMEIGINAGAGALSGGVSTVAVDGIATFDTLSIDKAGDGYTLVAKDDAETLTEVESNTFDIRIGAPAAVEITQQPGNGTAGESLSPTLIARVVDSQGNVVEDFAHDIEVSFGENPLGGTLGGTITLTPVDGEAEFDDLWIDRAAAGYTLVASAFGVASAETDPFDIGPNVAFGVTFEQQPGESSQNSVIVPSPKVKLVDEWGNLVPDDGVSITVAIGVNPGGGTLSGTLTQSTVDGIATFGDLVIDAAGDGYTLVAGNGSLAQGESIPFNIIAVGDTFNIFSPDTPDGDIVGYLPTIVAGEPFCVDVVAIDADGVSQKTNYNGEITLQMIDSSVNTGSLLPGNCRSSWTVIQEWQAIPFPNSANGRINACIQLGEDLVEPDVWPNVRFRAYQTQGQGGAGCSNDNFAIRPDSFALGGVQVTDTDWQTAGTDRSLVVATPSADGGNVHAAGRSFRVEVQAVNSDGVPTSNYDGEPAIEVLDRVLPAGCAGCPPGEVLTSGWGPVSGTAGAVRTNNAIYHDAGVITVRVIDETFSAVDQVDIDLGLMDPNEGVITSGQLDIGRFVPDNFAVVPDNTPLFETQGGVCGADRFFTYLGQDFGYATAPAAQILARSANGDITPSYRDELWKLEDGDSSQEYDYNTVPADAAVLNTDMAPLADAAVASNGDGTGTLTVFQGDSLHFEREPLEAPGGIVEDPPAPFDAFITLTLRVSDTSESGVPGNASINTAVPGIFNNIGFDGEGGSPNQFRYGRLRLINVVGSELEPLEMPYRIETWQEVAVDIFSWQVESEDLCTAFDAADFAIQNIEETGVAGLDPTPFTVAQDEDGGEVVGGRGTLTFPAQDAQVTGSFDVFGTPVNNGNGIHSYLLYNWDTIETGADTGPTGKAAYGINEGNPRRIYRTQRFGGGQ